MAVGLQVKCYGNRLQISDKNQYKIKQLENIIIVDIEVSVEVSCSHKKIEFLILITIFIRPAKLVNEYLFA